MELEREGGDFTIPKKRKITLENDSLIEKSWSRLEKGEINADRFITDVAQGLKHGRHAESIEMMKEGELK